MWGAGTALAAAALRSSPLTVGAALLGISWVVTSMSGRKPDGLPDSYLLVAAALWVLSLWTGSRPARHVILLSLFSYTVFLYMNDEWLAAPAVLALLSAGLLALHHSKKDISERFLDLGNTPPVHALLGFLTAIGIIQVHLIDEHEFAVASILAFGGIIAALLLAGRDNALLRWLAYVAFAFQLCFVYVVMFGSMLGTAGFFLLAGIFLASLAWLIARMERRFGTAPAEGGAQ